MYGAAASRTYMSSLLWPEKSREALARGAAAALDKNEGIAAIAARVKDVVAAAWKET